MKFITIDSKIDIVVTNGLTNIDKTNYSSKVNNTLNIAPLWCRNAVKVRKGKHLYPVEIADWPTVKVLDANGSFTIGREADDGTPEEEQMLKEFLDSKAQIEAETEPKRRRKSSEETGK